MSPINVPHRSESLQSKSSYTLIIDRSQGVLRGGRVTKFLYNYISPLISLKIFRINNENSFCGPQFAEGIIIMTSPGPHFFFFPGPHKGSWRARLSLHKGNYDCRLLSWIIFDILMFILIYLIFNIGHWKVLICLWKRSKLTKNSIKHLDFAQGN